MALPIKDQLKYWGITLALLFAILWLMGGVMLPFLVAGALAYFLDPVADRLQRAGLSRVGATAVITLIGLLTMVLVVLAVIPTLIHQTTALINAAPEISQRLQGFLTERFPSFPTVPQPSARRWPRSQARLIQRGLAGHRGDIIGAERDFGAGLSGGGASGA